MARIDDPHLSAAPRARLMRDRARLWTEPERSSTTRRALLLVNRRDLPSVLQGLTPGTAEAAGWTIAGLVLPGASGHASEVVPLRRRRWRRDHPNGPGALAVYHGTRRLAEWVELAAATEVIVLGDPTRAARQFEAGSGVDRPEGRTPRFLTWSQAQLDGPGETSEAPLGSGRVERSVPNPGATPIPSDRLGSGQLGKRLFDQGLAVLGLLVASPLLLAVMALIVITSGRPIFYGQERIGRCGRRFTIWKFRSMRTDSEARTGPIWATENDDRCTPLGAWLRKTSIDELPQLWNVLLGQMSLVGPRPERPFFVDQFRSEIPRYGLRHSMPVGLTGWAQVHGWRGRTSLRKRLQFDLDYIRRWSLRLDVQVLAMTVVHLLAGKTRWKTR